MGLSPGGPWQSRLYFLSPQAEIPLKDFLCAKGDPHTGWCEGVLCGNYVQVNMLSSFFFF